MHPCRIALLVTGLICVVAATGCPGPIQPGTDMGPTGTDMGMIDTDMAVGTDSGAMGSDAAAVPVSCPMMGLAESVEAEPNEDAMTATPAGTVTSPGFCVTGTLTCGNDGMNFTGGLDWVSFEVDATVTGTFQMDWISNNDTDMDFLLLDDPMSAMALIDFEVSLTPPETGMAALMPATTYYIRMGCWEGQSGNYAIWATW